MKGYTENTTRKMITFGLRSNTTLARLLRACRSKRNAESLLLTRQNTRLVVQSLGQNNPHGLAKQNVPYRQRCFEFFSIGFHISLPCRLHFTINAPWTPPELH